MATANEFIRLAAGGGTITAADANMLVSNIPRIVCVGGGAATIGAVADTDGATLKGRWVLFDSADPQGLNATGNPVGVSPQYTFTAGTGPFGGCCDYALPSARLATPNANTSINLSGAYALIFLVDAVSAGNWVLFGRFSSPIPQ